MKGLRITAVDCGPLDIPKGFLMTGEEGIISIPSAAYIIEHPKHGLIRYRH